MTHISRDVTMIGNGVCDIRCNSNDVAVGKIPGGGPTHRTLPPQPAGSSNIKPCQTRSVNPSDRPGIGDDVAKAGIARVRTHARPVPSRLYIPLRGDDPVFPSVAQTPVPA